MSARAAHRVPVAFLSFVLVACASPATPTDEPLTGGTLRVAMVEGGGEVVPGAAYYDPAFFFIRSPLFRCCLVRTLLSYNGRPTEDGGAELHPDLARELPEISADGLTWTFRLKPGLHYAPPLADRVIEARDFVTAIEYAVRFGDPIFDAIVGVPEYRDRSVDTIAGLEAADATTLVVHLRTPAGNLGNLMATIPSAPIPAEALDGREEAGYAGFLVASGPYMYEGADSIDLADPDAEPIWSGRDNEPVVLVRNPSWERASDALRGAYVERVEVRLTTSREAAARLVEDGLADVMGEPAPLSTVERYRADPALRERVYTQSASRVHYVAMNVAAPPFDDPRVRRAVNFVIDRAAAAATLQEDRQELFVVANHAIPDLLLNNLLVGYAPYSTSGDGGDLGAAQEEMRESSYDGDGDGSCDADACSEVATVFIGESAGLRDLVTANLAEIGVELTQVDRDPFDPQEHVAASVGIGWQTDIPHAADFGGLFRGSGLPDGVANVSLLGAEPDDLASWGYEVEDVPDLDTQIDSCLAAVGSEGFECWAELDQLMMERAVAWAPFAFGIAAWITSDRVAAFSADADSIGPSLDQIQLSGEP